jgi:hypothetical protein
MLRRALLLLTVLTVCVHASSCVNSREYVTTIVDITPSPTGLDRQITIYRTNVSDSTRTRLALRLDPETADRLERIYGVRPLTAGSDSGTPPADTTAPYVGRGSFTSIPDDLNNRGTLRSFPSALGSFWMYMERIGGEPDAEARLQRSLAAADSMTDRLVGWSEAEWGWHPKWPALRSSIAVDLRRTLRNLVLDRERGDSGSGDRLIVAVLDQPLLFMAIPEQPPEEEVDDVIMIQGYLQEMRTRIAETLELRSDAEVGRVLHQVSHPDSVRRSFGRYLARTTGLSEEAALLSWTKTLERMRGDEESSSGSPGTTDSLAVRLSLPPGIQNLESNAKSDSSLASPAWQGWVRGLPNPSSGLPFVCWATWVQPDSATQSRLFGEVKLDEDDLFQYCLWFNTLDAKHQAEWNKMIRRLRPGKLKPLERFRFSDAKRHEEQKIPGRDLLLDELD